MKLNCVIAARSFGEPKLTATVVECSRQQYADGEHYEAAEAWAKDKDYDGPMIIFDQHDGPAWLFGHFPWDKMTKISPAFCAARFPALSDTGDVMLVKCVIACTDANGEPDFTFVIVECTESQFNKGAHYKAAKCWARSEGNGGEMVVFDEHDRPGRWLFERFVWESASHVVLFRQPT